MQAAKQAATTGRIGRLSGWIAGAATAAALGVASMAPLAATGLLVTAGTPAIAQAEGDAPDLIVFHDGRSVRGKILEETADRIRMQIVFRGIKSETTYNRGDIASITRGAPADEPVADEKDPVVRVESRRGTPRIGEPAKRAPMGDDIESASEGGARVYHLELTGYFGKDISKTPIRDAVEEAEKLGADYLVVSVDSTWRQRGAAEDLADDAAAFDQIWKAEEIAPIFFREIPQTWERPAKVVFWVKRAMGGAAFLPLCVEDVYFAEDGKMGGIGNLGQLFDQGDEVVKEKQYSLRLAAAKGLAEEGGHEPKIVEAMARREYQLWARYRGGEVLFIDNPALVEEGDIVLVDNGEGENEDTDEQIVREQGNDVLTLDADLAFNLGLSKGTVDTLDDLLFELGIERQAVILETKAEKTMERWRKQVKKAEKDLEDLWEEYNETQANGGDEREQRRALSTRIAKAQDMIRILRRYEEAITPGQLGVPGIAQLEIMIEQIRLQILASRN